MQIRIVIKIIFIITLLIFQTVAQASHCYDPTGRVVQELNNNQIPFYSVAKITENNFPQIILNPKKMKSFSSTQKKFVFWHECGHHALGQLLFRKPITVVEEQEADCFGIRAALTLGQISHTELTSLQSELSKLGNGDVQHFSGGQRALNVDYCIGKGKEVSYWNECKIKFYKNIELLKKSTEMISKMATVCKTRGVTAPDCIQGATLTQVLHKETYKMIGMLDETCPFIMDPIFQKIMFDFHKSLNYLLKF